jgi:hypothetical protein
VSTKLLQHLDSLSFIVCRIATGVGGVEWFERSLEEYAAAGKGYSGLRTIDPFLVPALITNTASGMIAIDLGWQY